MTVSLKRLALCVAASTLSMVAAGAAHAQGFPTKPVSIVVPFAAGGPTDTVARQVGQAMEKTLGQPVVVENKPGAGGTLGAADVARAQPDGYKVLV